MIMMIMLLFFFILVVVVVVILHQKTENKIQSNPNPIIINKTKIFLVSLNTLLYRKKNEVSCSIFFSKYTNETKKKWSKAQNDFGVMETTAKKNIGINEWIDIW